ncbi:MAG: hypothetical protein HY558_06115 [Euryarchaeota archaeon]|nr:hypothetical protein [Euryarchaeota archaeon]
MADLCEACGKTVNLFFMRRMKEEGNDCSIYQCPECRAFSVRGSMTERAMRAFTARIDVPWHVDEEKNRFVCEYSNLHLVFPMNRSWSCDKCFRSCVYDPKLTQGALTFNRRPM